MAVFPAFFGLLFLVLVKGQTVDISPQEAVVKVREEITVLCRVSYPIDSCRFSIGPEKLRLNPQDQTGDIIYTGRGLQMGECGAIIRNVREEWNGNVSCVLPPPSGNRELTGTMNLIVARAPEDPQLTTTPQRKFREGDIFSATCEVRGGRPAATISWWLDNEKLLEGIHAPNVTGTGIQTITQSITRTLLADDSNRRLSCRAEHPALDTPKTAARQIIVNYPPKRQEAGTGPITIFGLKLGSEGRLNVTVRANPAPNVEWTVEDQRLVPGSSNVDGTVSALEPVYLGNGYYNITLLLTTIAKEDVDRTYYLRANNELGSEELAVRLSTMDEPAGVELGTGAIIGIVIAVLILLVAVFLGVFAKATDRWCFGDARRRDQTKSSGESTPAGDVLLESRTQQPTRTSDTESAVGGKERSRLAELGARMRAVLPRSKDKVQATETPAANDNEEKPLSEPKKDVVYAELALGEARDKPAPESTEYAQIVYTNTSETAPATEKKE